MLNKEMLLTGKPGTEITLHLYTYRGEPWNLVDGQNGIFDVNGKYYPLSQSDYTLEGYYYHAYLKLAQPVTLRCYSSFEAPFKIRGSVTNGTSEYTKYSDYYEYVISANDPSETVDVQLRFD